MGISASLMVYQVTQQRSLAFLMLDARTSLTGDIGFAVSGNRTIHQKRPCIEWLDMHDFYVYLDAFSDSWYMSTRLFVDAKSKIEDIDAVEEACFLMFEDREDKVRMALDWLDWSVEHMSKWWKTLGAPKDPYAHRRVLHYLDRYRARKSELLLDYEPHRLLLRPTIALIAFQQSKESGMDHDAGLGQRYRDLTKSSLAATISSLVQLGMGRIVVVGHDKEEFEERPLVYGAFDMVFSSFIDPSSSLNASSSHESKESASTYRTVRGSQLAYVTVSNDTVFTDFVSVNMPRGALLGLHRALTERNDRTWSDAWLGKAASDTDDASTDSDRDDPPSSVVPVKWKYVYLTEPDTLLHTRPRTVPNLKDMLDRGHILAPHRWQPIPYQADVPESISKRTFISEGKMAASAFRSVRTLDSMTDACCDEQMGIKHRPGSHAAIGSNCGDFWWKCGFVEEEEPEADSIGRANTSAALNAGNHSRVLDLYGLIRLHDGTRVATLAGSEHGRRCLPQSNMPCERRRRNTNANLWDKSEGKRPRNPWVTPAKKRRRRQEREERITRETRNSSVTSPLRAAQY
jgi:hypothetical protein